MVYAVHLRSHPDVCHLHHQLPLVGGETRTRPEAHPSASERLEGQGVRPDDCGCVLRMGA